MVMTAEAPPNLWLAVLPLIGTVLGAFIGAGTSYLIAQQNLKNTREAARLQRRDHERVATMQATVKLMRLANTLYGLQSQIEEGREATSQQQGFDLNAPASYVRAVEIDDGAFVRFEVEELVVFLEARRGDFLSRIIMLGDRYNGLMEGIRAYGAARNAFLLQFPALMQGGAGQPLLTNEQLLKAAPHYASLNVTAGLMIEHIDEYLTDARTLAQDFGPIVRKYFDDPAFPVPSLAVPAAAPSADGPVS
jgi:hypothetical protein